MTKLLEAAKDALSELEALITGRGPCAADERVVGPDADRIAERLDATIKKTEALKASYEPPKVLAYGDLAEGMTVPLRWCDDDPS